MNKKVILFHLLECKEQLNETISEINNKDYAIEEFRVDMGHAVPPLKFILEWKRYNR